MSAVAGRQGVNPNQMFGWRKQCSEGSLAAVKASETVVPASELATAIKKIRKLQRLRGKNTIEVEILKEAVEWWRSKELVARSLLVGAIFEKGLRSFRHCALWCSSDTGRSPCWQDGRSAKPTDDSEFVEEIQAHITHRPTYGYQAHLGTAAS
ncbi:transposase [Paraburkholderia sp. Ac-20347]|nr:transposase [Paraburkholderia sp. Ac-20347]